ncbi:hypothetical protein DSO57_1027327 [Entomophthora muscae]|uniref:Uncharacterized protein n=1 Tax=Entomophthora muscae TaxID=34485 RepID=A0ACC2SEM7_9FUNG|nr:hypothetical protein DSO57_1027327 [Entomophthora muscae]
MSSTCLGLTFRDREPGDECDIIPDAKLLASCKKGDLNSLQALETYYGPNQILFAVRVGFWDKPSGVDPIEYARCFSGVAKIKRNISKCCS